MWQYSVDDELQKACILFIGAICLEPRRNVGHDEPISPFDFASLYDTTAKDRMVKSESMNKDMRRLNSETQLVNSYRA